MYFFYKTYIERKEGFKKFKDVEISLIMPDLYQRINKKKLETESLYESIYSYYRNSELRDFSDFLTGSFSIVIVDNEQISIFIDHKGLEIIYYYVDTETIIISDKLLSMKQDIALSVNPKMLLQYFTYCYDFTSETLCKNVYKALPHEPVVINLGKHRIDVSEDGHIVNAINSGKNQKKEKDIINDITNIIKSNIQICAENKMPQEEIVNTFSGGVDSSFIQVLCAELGCKKALTYSFNGDTSDISYANDFKNNFAIDLTQFDANINDYYDALIESIRITEVPHSFGDALFFNSIKNSSNQILFSGSGADNVMGHGLLLFQLFYLKHIIPIAYHINRLINIEVPLVRYLRIKDINLLNEMIKSNKFSNNYFYKHTQRENLEIIKKAFGVSSLESMFDEFVIRVNKLSNYNIIDKLNVFFSYYARIDWMDRLWYQMARNQNSIVIFPYSEKNLIEYLLNVPTRLKIKRFKNKYLLKKALRRYLPGKYVYRKKQGLLTKNLSSFKYFNHSPVLKKMIEEIKAAEYPYFNFNYDQIFSEKKFEGIAALLINFHIWHKEFID